MPVTFRILPDRALAYARFDGLITVDQAGAAFEAYAHHPDWQPDQMHLLDMSRVTAWTPDFAGLMQLHAAQIDVLFSAKHEILYVYYAPDEPARALAQMAMRAWDEAPRVIAALQETEADALHVLGQPERTFEALLQNV